MPCLASPRLASPRRPLSTCTNVRHRFADKFNLRQYINFRTKVEKVKRCPKAGKWTVSFKRNRYSPPHRAYPEVPAENPEVRYYCMVKATYPPPPGEIDDGRRWRNRKGIR